MFEWKEKASNAILLDEVPGKGRSFQCKFLEPGLVKYSFGVCLLTEEALRKFAMDFVGCPVIVDHQDLTEETADDARVGVISNVHYSDGWYWCDGIIFDNDAIELVNQGYNVSCQYEITEYAENKDGKLHNGNPYDKIILNGKPEHLAIVKNPRYENAMIAVNATEVAMNEEKKEGEWITIKGTHVFIPKGKSVESIVEERFGKGTEVDEVEKASKLHKDIHEQYEYMARETRREHDSLKGKYSKKDIKFDARQIEGDVELAQQHGYDTVEKISDFLCLDENKVREVLYSTKRGENKSNKEGFKPYVKNLLKRANLMAGVENFRTSSDGYAVRFTLPRVNLDARQKQFEKILDKDVKVEKYDFESGGSVYIRFKKNNVVKNSIIQAINEIKETDMFKNLFNKKEKKMDKEEMKALFMECLLEAKNEADKEEEKKAENEDDELKEKEEEKVEEKEAENKCKNEEPDYKALYEELKAKVEAKNEEEEKEKEKEEAKNSIEEQAELFVADVDTKTVSNYISKAKAIELGNQLF